MIGETNYRIAYHKAQRFILERNTPRPTGQSAKPQRRKRKSKNIDALPNIEKSEKQNLENHNVEIKDTIPNQNYTPADQNNNLSEYKPIFKEIGIDLDKFKSE